MLKQGAVTTLPRVFSLQYSCYKEGGVRGCSLSQTAPAGAERCD